MGIEDSLRGILTRSVTLSGAKEHDGGNWGSRKGWWKRKPYVTQGCERRRKSKELEHDGSTPLESIYDESDLHPSLETTVKRHEKRTYYWV